MLLGRKYGWFIGSEFWLCCLALNIKKWWSNLVAGLAFLTGIDDCHDWNDDWQNIPWSNLECMKIEKRQLKNIRFGIVIFSILLMICSALISYSLVKRNDDKIANLQSEITKEQEAIDNIWQSSLNQETRIDNAILISLLSKNHKKDYSKIITKLLLQLYILNKKCSNIMIKKFQYNH